MFSFTLKTSTSQLEDAVFYTDSYDKRNKQTLL